MTADAAVPLARLFAMAFRTLIDELHERLDGRGWHDMRPAYGFVLLAARDEPTTATDVANLLGMTKQAASKLIDVMQDAGYVRRQPHADDARAKLVTVTSRGRRLLADAEEIYAELEAEWSQIAGRDHIEAMRSDLLAVLRTMHDGRLPAIRPTW